MPTLRYILALLPSALHSHLLRHRKEYQMVVTNEL